MEAISRAYFWWKDVRYYVIRSNEWTKKTRPDHERDAVDGQWFERSIRKENFDFNITFVTTFEIDSMKKKKKVAFLEGNRNRIWMESRFSLFVFFFLCFPQILPLGYFFPLIPLINIIRFRNTDGTIKLVVSISVCGRVWNGNKVF